MSLLSLNNIKSELSYAYLHAVASRAGLACEIAGRHSDGAGVDAVLRAKEVFDPKSILTQMTVDIQLKATSAETSTNTEGCYPFPLEIDHYDRLRNTATAAPQILVVLFLPRDEKEWLAHSADCLIARRCAYWTSLRGEPPIANKASRTIYIPETNHFSVEAIRSIFRRYSIGEWGGHEL